MRVAVLDDYQGIALEMADWGRLEPVIFREHLEDVEPLLDFEIVVAMRERMAFSRERLERLPNLKLLVTTGRANASIDVASAREIGIVVSGTEGLAAPTSELTWALILAVTRNVVREDRAVRDGGWQHSIGPHLEGGTLGVMGLGRQGARVAAIGRAFGMRVIAWSQNLQAPERVSKEELLRESDVLTIHLKLSDRTRGLVGADELAQMKPTAYLINTSRGPIVDEPALLDALHAGTIAGAALDVFDVEPLAADHPLRSAPNTVLTPHLGYVSTGNYQLFFRGVVEAVEAYRHGSPIRVLV
jgi:phosphoglycerate dehydrogenase-like enzyme